MQYFTIKTSLYFCIGFVLRFVRVKPLLLKHLRSEIQKVQKFSTISIYIILNLPVKLNDKKIISSYRELIEIFCIFCILVLNSLLLNNLARTKLCTKLKRVCTFVQSFKTVTPLLIHFEHHQNNRAYFQYLHNHQFLHPL